MRVRVPDLHVAFHSGDVDRGFGIDVPLAESQGLLRTPHPYLRNDRQSWSCVGYPEAAPCLGFSMILKHTFPAAIYLNLCQSP